jgi:hypothetical protein
MNKMLLIAAAVLVTGIGEAHAQDAPEGRWRVQLGVGSLTQTSGKDLLGKQPLSFGVSYDQGRLAGGSWGFFCDGSLRRRKIEGDTRTQSAIGIGVQLRRPAGNSLYYGVGLGQFHYQGGTSNSVIGSNANAFGARVFGGKDLGRYFGELGYTYIRPINPRSNFFPGVSLTRYNVSTVSLRAGVRF